MRKHGSHDSRLTFAALPALALAIAGATLVAGCTHAPSSRASAPVARSLTARPAQVMPVETPSVAPPPTPVATPAQRPRPPRAATPEPTPHGTAAASKHVVAIAAPAGPATHILRPHDPPEIYGVSISPTVAGGGEVVSGTVTTSSNVASVVASVAGITSGVPKIGVGEFAMSYRLPPVIPQFVKGSYTIVVVARNVDGRSTSRAVGITLH